MTGFWTRVEQTDLFIRADRDLSDEAYPLIIEGRKIILDWSRENPEFLTSLSPLPLKTLAWSPVRDMLHAGQLVEVGPMAAVAGAMAEFVGRGLLKHSPGGVVVENGGDIFLAARIPVRIGLFAGKSVLSMKLGLKVDPEDMPLGICTSAGTVGHSYSLGRADAATVAADNAALADAAATGLGNRIRTVKDIEPALKWVHSIEGVRGAVAILGDKFGMIGDLDLVSL